MNDNVYYIAELTVIAELKEIINVFGVSLKLRTPFTDAAIICIRGFFMSKISGFKRSFPDSRKVDKRSDKPYLERVKEFSPEMDFFSSSTVMQQRDLTGQDYLLITLPMISKRLRS